MTIPRMVFSSPWSDSLHRHVTRRALTATHGSRHIYQHIVPMAHGYARYLVMRSDQ